MRVGASVRGTVGRTGVTSNGVRVARRVGVNVGVVVAVKRIAGATALSSGNGDAWAQAESKVRTKIIAG